MVNRNIWVVSDTHFNHENIIRYCGRPFANAEEMNLSLIDKWNSVVKPHDIVYHLGDVYIGKPDKVRGILPLLVGRKRLILGNHDNIADGILHKHFEKILVWRQFKDFGVTLSHIPLHEGSLNDRFPINVHGHIHEKLVDDPRYVNVSVEHTNYGLINLEEIKQFGEKQHLQKNTSIGKETDWGPDVGNEAVRIMVKEDGKHLTN